MQCSKKAHLSTIFYIVHVYYNYDNYLDLDRVETVNAFSNVLQNQACLTKRSA